MGALSAEQKFNLFDQMINEVYNYFQIRNIYQMDEKEYFLFKEHVEELEDKIEKVNFSKDIKKFLLKKITAIKVGSKISLNYLEQNQDLYHFIKVNKLDLIFFATKLKFKFDKNKGVMIPVELRKNCTSWYPWNELRWEKTEAGYSIFFKVEKLFETDDQKKFLEDYYPLMYGITKYNIIESADFRPYKYVDPSSYGYQNLLVIQITWAADKKVSYFHQTHVSLELKDENGLIRSVGQDIFDHVHTSPKHRFSRAAKRSSIIKTPDLTSYYPKNYRKIKKIYFPISKNEHDRLVKIVESDKYNHRQTASLMKGNCVSYAASLLKRGLDYNIKADVAGFEILTRNIFSEKVDRFIQKTLNKLKKLPQVLQKAFFFFPPIYILGGIIGYINYLTSKTGYNDHREYTMKDYLVSPWKIRCDIPLILKEVLEKHADENGVICREKYPPGSIID